MTSNELPSYDVEESNLTFDEFLILLALYLDDPVRDIDEIENIFIH